jgi:mono/diheme cytochrome c family protein
LTQINAHQDITRIKTEKTQRSEEINSGLFASAVDSFGHAPMKASRFAALAIIASSAALGPLMGSAQVQTKPAEGEAAAGRILALRACTGCHIVAPDQPFQPIFTGPPRPPDFKEIANQSNMTAASLQHHLETLPAVSKDLHMANAMLSREELRDVVAFIITLRENQ